MCTSLVVFACLTAMPAAAGAQGVTFSAWDGTNPFRCTLQNAGTGTAVPNPNADPYCVIYDKTGQSVLPDLGILTFLSEEPARIQIAFNKCFYFQEDHWTGALVQGDPSTQLWNWVGHYYLDFATGSVGAYLQDFYLGPPGAMSSLTFGGQLTDVLPINPKCVARARRWPPVYATSNR
jgi:hypothetical protein